LAGLALDEEAEVGLARKDRLARLLHAARAQRIGRTRPPEGRKAPLARLEKRRRRPLGPEALTLECCVPLLHQRPDDAGGGDRDLLELSRDHVNSFPM